MSLQRLDHYSIRTAALEQTRNFYVNVLGLEEGFRPAFDFPGHWLYCGERAVVHLIGVTASSKQDLDDFLGDREIAADGSGALDHVAFRAEDLPALRQRLAEHQLGCRERTIPALDLHLVFIEDPNGIVVELNYVAAEADASGC